MRKILFAVIVLMAVWGAVGKLAPPKIEDYTYVCREVLLRNVARDVRPFAS